MEGQNVGPSHATMNARSSLVASYWFIGFTLALASFFVFPAGGAARVLAGLVALFCGQGFIAEWIGVRCDRDSISFPRRLFPGIGFPTVWRRRISVRKISRMDSVGQRAILFYLSSTERVAFVFPDNRSRHQVIRFLNEAIEARRHARRHAAVERNYGAHHQW
ncbi:hypothetical protein WOC76_05745 [Methylocystis sp. IM3]|uniref:hypothetical protein n=1 Tax=unclassified Methylocystis TaxID=2625913 RepID=UPI0030FB5906